MNKFLSLFKVLFFFFPILSLCAEEQSYIDVRCRRGLNSNNNEYFLPCKKFVVITPPKCGTYLLVKLLSHLTSLGVCHYVDYYLKDVDLFFKKLSQLEREKRFLVTHIEADEKVVQKLITRGYSVISIIRDPRDQLISSIHWILSGYDTNHLFDVPVNLFKQLEFVDRVNELMTGDYFGFKVFDALYKRHFG